MIISHLKQGDEEAVRKLWDRFFEPLKRVAQRRLTVRQRKTLDEEDLALNAITAFQKGLENDRYDSIEDRNDVWRMLTTILEHQTIDHLRYQRAAKRGGGMQRGESYFSSPDDERNGIGQIVEGGIDPEAAVDIIDKLDAIYEKLNDRELIQVVNARIAGYTNAEIAAQIGKSISSVERKIRLARDIWMEADAE